MTRAPARTLTVAVTGPTGDFGTLLLPRLQADAGVHAILAVGPRPLGGEKMQFHRVDLTHFDSEGTLAALLSRVDVLYHLAFLYGRSRSQSVAHELEVIGSMHLLGAAARAGVRKLVVPSLTMVYGARPGNPVLLPETAPLHGCPSSRFVTDRVEVERQLAAFRTAHPEVEVVVLRFPLVLGPTMHNPATRYFRRPVSPTLLGFDPLWQALHEEDAVDALVAVLRRPAPGAWNVVNGDLLSLSAMVRIAGGRLLPLPPLLARAALKALNGAGVTATPPGLLDYLHYGWAADGSAARAELGFQPRHSARAALESLRS